MLATPVPKATELNRPALGLIAELISMKQFVQPIMPHHTADGIWRPFQ
jgi:hypothetical protein